MLKTSKAITGRMRRALSREEGNATIEFVLLFPALITLFLMVIEAGLLMTRGVMLDRAVDLSVREIRLGTLTPMTAEGLKQAICNRAVIIPDCLNSVTVEMRPLSKTTWGPLTGSATCIDRSQSVKPVLEFTPGTQNEMMLIRVCSIFDPLFPTSALAAQIKLDSTGAYALVAMSAFVNEP